MIRLAIFGAGRIGTVHALNAVSLPDVRIRWIVDPAPGALALAETLGARIGSRDQALADPALDGVVIASSTDTHAALLRAALDRGLPVFCEKPVSLDFATTLAMTQAIETANLPCMLGFQRRYDPNFRAVRDRIASGQAGALEQLLMQTRDPAPPPIDYVTRSGGMLRDQAIHDFDQARFMLGEEIASVHAIGTCQIDPAIGAAGDIDSLMVTMRSDSGRMVQMANARRSPMGYDQRLEAHCASEVLLIQNRPQSDIRIAGPDGMTSAPPMDYFIARFAEAYRAEMQAFVTLLREGTPPLATIRDGCEAQRLAEAAIQSIATGQTVQVSRDWLPGQA